MNVKYVNRLGHQIRIDRNSEIRPLKGEHVSLLLDGSMQTFEVINIVNCVDGDSGGFIIAQLDIIK